MLKHSTNLLGEDFLSEPRTTPKKVENKKQNRKIGKSRPKASLYNSGDIEDIAYSERSERYPI
jgi:hypothetical protein